MTRPIADGAQRQRAGLACLACRAAKAKCDGRPPAGGVQSVKVCTRCSRAGVACDWVKSKRYRSKNRAQSSEGSSTQLPDLSDSPIAAQLDQLMLSLIDPASTGHPTFGSHIADYSVPTLDIEPNPSGPLRSVDSLEPFPHHDCSANFEISGDLNGPAPEFTTDLDPSLHDSNDTQRPDIPPCSVENPTCAWAQMDATEREEVEELIYLYYDHVHPFIPVLPCKADFLSKISEASTSLLHVVCALASRVGESSRFKANLKSYSIPASSSTDETWWQTSWREWAEYSVDTDAFSVGSDHCQQLESIQALILHVYLAYGLGRQQRALDMLRRAAQRAIWAGLHILDMDGPVSQTAKLHKLVPMGKPFPLPLREIARRTWWELWSVDILMGTVNGKPGLLAAVLEEEQQADAVKVEVPGVQVGGDERTRTSIHLRYQAISFLPACSAPSQHLSSAVQMERFTALKKSIDNLLISLQSIWYEAVAKERENIEHALWTGLPECYALVESWRTERESAFMGLMVLYASTIYLHLLHMPLAVPITVTSCSLRVHPPLSSTDMVEGPRAPYSKQSTLGPTSLTSSPQTPRQSRVTSTPPSASFYLDNIIKASQCIFATFRLVHEHVNDMHRLKTTDSTHTPQGTIVPGNIHIGSFMRGSSDVKFAGALTRPLHIHSPFFGCSHVVGAFGLLLGLHANAPSNTGISPTSHLFPHLAGDIFGKTEAEQVVGWRAVSMRSDVGLAEEALCGQAQWWPIARTLFDELQRASSSY